MPKVRDRHDFLRPPRLVLPNKLHEDLHGKESAALYQPHRILRKSKKKLPFDFIRTRKGIIRELLISKESEITIGVLSPSLGESMFLILVRSIASQNLDEKIAFQVYDLKEGRFRAIARLTVNEIKGGCPLCS